MVNRTLVTGGVRSGKSAVAQRLVEDSGGPVTYIAVGPSSDDADWRRRIAAHRRNRPASWRTVEPSSRELPGLLRTADQPVIVECIGTWLTALLDDVGAWTTSDDLRLSEERWPELLAAVLDDVVAAVQQCDVPLILVTNEVGWGLVSEHRSGRIFADELGRLNQRIAAVCEDVILVVAGLPVTVKAGKAN